MSEDNPTLGQFETQMNSTRYREEQRLEARRRDQKSAEKEFQDRMKAGMGDPETKRALSKEALRHYQNDGSGGDLHRLMVDDGGTIGFTDFEPSINQFDLKKKLWERE